MCIALTQNLNKENLPVLCICRAFVGVVVSFFGDFVLVFVHFLVLQSGPGKQMWQSCMIYYKTYIQAFFGQYHAQLVC